MLKKRLSLAREQSLLSIWSPFLVVLKSDLVVQQTEGGLLNKSSCLALALGATKFTNVIDMIFALLYFLSRTWIMNKPPSDLSMNGLKEEWT